MDDVVENHRSDDRNPGKCEQHMPPGFESPLLHQLLIRITGHRALDLLQVGIETGHLSGLRSKRQDTAKRAVLEGVPGEAPLPNLIPLSSRAAGALGVLQLAAALTLG